MCHEGSGYMFGFPLPSWDTIVHREKGKCCEHRNNNPHHRAATP